MSAAPSTIQRGQPISEAYELLKSAPFHHLPVMDGSQVVGMLSSIDLLALAYDADGTDDRTLKIMLDHQFTIDDAMSTDIVSLPGSATIEDAANALSDGSRHSVLIIDADQMLSGIVTTTDLVRFLVDLYN